MPGIDVLWLAVGPLPEGLDGGVPEPAGWELPDDGGLPDCDVGCPGGVLPDGWLGGCDPLGGILAGGMLLGGMGGHGRTRRRRLLAARATGHGESGQGEQHCKADRARCSPGGNFHCFTTSGWIAAAESLVSSGCCALTSSAAASGGSSG
jgi:hypothetical protein